MVGADGRVRVLDFGLARASDDVTERAEPPTLDSGERLLDTPLTIEGVVVGTPAYMAPEQFAGGKSDARTDQFSFCVSLYEALCGKRPAVATTSDVSDKHERAETNVSEDRGLPRWLHRMLSRGLSIAPKDRYPDMRALLADLRADPAAKRRKLALAGGAAMVLGAGAWILVHRGGGDEKCQGAEQRLAGVWDPAVERAVGDAFKATGRWHAAATFARAGDALDAYARTWIATSTESCRATARGDQSAQLLDLRAACLDRRLHQLGALTDVFAKHATTDVVDNAVPAIASLSDLRECDDAQGLTSATPPPDPRLRARVDALRERLNHVEALDKAGVYTEALALAKPLSDETRHVDYAPLQLDALFELANLEQISGSLGDAEAHWVEVTKLAAKSRRDGTLAAAMTKLVDVIGRVPKRLAEAKAQIPIAEGVLDRLGDDGARASLEINVGTMLHRAGDFDGAFTHLEHARALAEKGTDQLQIASISTDIGTVLDSQGKYDEARHAHERALAIEEKQLGPEHPHLAAPLNNLGNLVVKQGRYDDAQKYLERALALREKALPPDHPDVAAIINNLAEIDEARGDYATAYTRYMRALGIFEHHLGPNDPTVGVALNNVGEALQLQGKPRDALGYYERALATWAKSLPPEHPLLAYALTGVGVCQLALDAPAKAIDPLEHALKLRTGAGAEPLLGAETRFALARALWNAKRDRKRAKGLAQDARTAYVAGGEHERKHVDEVDAWLAHAK
jgi:tetratricopeptide (TPR) repeat protein